MPTHTVPETLTPLTPSLTGLVARVTLVPALRFTQMKTVAVRELQQHSSSVARRARDGESVGITNSDRETRLES